MEPFTKAPNFVLDNMDKMSNQCLRVVLAVVRKTIGWQKDEDIISVSQFQELTGMSDRGVKNGIAEALRDGWITRQLVNPKSKRSSYRYRVNSEQRSYLLVNVVPTQKKKEMPKSGSFTANVKVPWKQKMSESAFSPDEHEDALGGMSRIFGLR